MLEWIAGSIVELLFVDVDTVDLMEDFIGLATHSIDNVGSICMYLLYNARK